MENYIQSTFNQTPADLNDLVKAEQHNLDIEPDEAYKLGRVDAEEYGADSGNPFEQGTQEWDAWEAGFKAGLAHINNTPAWWTQEQRALDKE